jgi:hypothetical protein
MVKQVETNRSRLISLAYEALNHMETPPEGTSKLEMLLLLSQAVLDRAPEADASKGEARLRSGLWPPRKTGVGWRFARGEIRCQAPRPTPTYLKLLRGTNTLVLDGLKTPPARSDYWEPALYPLRTT